MTDEAKQALPFADRAALDRWFETHHAESAVLWVHLYRKGSGVPSVTWNDCVYVALAWGWIDGLKRTVDTISWVQRLTTRRRGSNWSPRNRAIAEKLIADGKLHPAGLAVVRSAQDNGRWNAAGAEVGAE